MDKTLTLNGRTFRIDGGDPNDPGEKFVSLVGPRGGMAMLVRNEPRPQFWALITSPGRNSKTTWFKQTDAGFEVVS